jgi:hypothetical protein
VRADIVRRDSDYFAECLLGRIQIAAPHRLLPNLVVPANVDFAIRSLRFQAYRAQSHHSDR